MYLQAAAQTLPGEGDGAFQYTKKVLAGDVAVLEFETTADGTYVNGVDIIRCDTAGRMLRPLRAINVVHEQMRACRSRRGSYSVYCGRPRR